MAKKKGSEEVVFVRFQCIKWNSTRRKVTLSWIEREGQDEIPCSKEFHQEPRDRMKNAFEALKVHAAGFLAITGAEKKKLQDQIEIRGINFSEDKSGIRAQMIVVRRIPDGKKVSAVNLNTPSFFSYLEDEENEDAMCWSPDCCDAIDKLSQAAEAYLGGDREPISELTGQPVSENGELFSEGDEAA